MYNKSFPNFRQLGLMDCGNTCLRIISKYYGKTISSVKVRELCYTTKEGVSLLGISDAAEKLGFRTRGVMITWEQLLNDVTLPCIAHWNQNHFIVVYKVKKNKVYVSDPSSGLLVYEKEEFIKKWARIARDGLMMGVALLLEPSPAFYQSLEYENQGTKLGFTKLLCYLKSYKRYIIQILLGLLIGSILNLILPFVSQSIVDVGIGTHDLDFVVVMLLAQIVIVIGQTSTDLIRGWLVLHMTTRLSISLISDFLSKLMRLPIGFFDTKKTGDILQRIGDYSKIQSFLTDSLLGIIMALVTFVVYGFVIIFYDWKIFLLFFVGCISYILWIVLFLKKRRKLDYMRFQESSSNQSNLVQLVTGMQDIKLNNCEKQKRWEWERIQARLFKVGIKSLTISQVQRVGGTFIDQTKNVLISFVAAKAVIDGNMTLGMMTAVQFIIGQLNAPVSQFIAFVQSVQDARIALERLNEIQDRDDEEPANSLKIRDIPENADIELKNVVYQYEGPRSPKVLDNISLVVPSNKVTAIVGESGSGKTTLLKMILGFYAPVEGHILLNNRDLCNYSVNAWRNNCGIVMQDCFIFSDTILNNICVSDEVPDMARIRYAIETANLEDILDNLPLGLNTIIGMEGHGLSTGQKQRILIARAIYKNSKFLFLDEATNSLDANNERFIMEKLNEIFKDKTVLIIAHRLSTVKNADNILVLDHGRIVETGKHDELIQKKGQYYRLVKNQLELND